VTFYTHRHLAQTHKEMDRKERRNESAITTSQSTNQSFSESLLYLTPDSDSGIILPMTDILEMSSQCTSGYKAMRRAEGMPESVEDQTVLCCCPKAKLSEQHTNEKCKTCMTAD